MAASESTTIRDASVLLIVPDAEGKYGWCLAVFDPGDACNYFNADTEGIDGHYDVVSRHDTQAAAVEALLVELKR